MSFYKGRSLVSVAREYKIPPSTLYKRVKIIGMTVMQAVNTKPLRTTHVEFNGQRKKVVEWAEELGISSKTIHRRLAKGYTEEEALSDLRYKDAKLLIKDLMWLRKKEKYNRIRRDFERAIPYYFKVA